MMDKTTILIGILIGIIVGMIIAGIITIFGISAIIGSISIENINSSISVNIPFNQTQAIEQISEKQTPTEINNFMYNGIYVPKSIGRNNS